MKNIYTSDWHIHTEASYDATLPMETLVKNAAEIGITEFGVTEHVNYPNWHPYLEQSRKAFDACRTEGMHFGVELTCLTGFQYRYALQKGFPHDRETIGGLYPEFSIPGFDGLDPDLIRLSAEQMKPFELALTEEDLQKYKVEYVVAAAHNIYTLETDRQTLIKCNHEQQMFCATDPRVDIVGHTWWLPYSLDTIERFVDKEGHALGEPWFDDFKVIPQSMHDELAAAVLENGKALEMNVSFFYTGMYSDSFKKQYAEYIRGMFEKGVPITIGSDSHDDYLNYQEVVAGYLAPVGFTAADFSKPKFRTYEK